MLAARVVVGDTTTRVRMRSDAQVSTPFWLLGAVGLYVAIANIRGRVLPSLRIRRRWLAWLVLLVSLLFLLVALALTAGNREAAAEARRLLASRPNGDFLGICSSYC